MTPIVILLAYLADLIFGDPHRIPHPVQGIGALIKGAESSYGRLNIPPRLYGVIANLLILIVVFAVSLTLAQSHWLLELYLLYTCLATRSLCQEGIKVRRILQQGNMAQARQELSYLVSRDTDEMDQQQVIRSTMETLSENIVDAITAPLFYILLGAILSIWLPGATAALVTTYKAINTFDSMWGYKNERYLALGWFSARLDDWANWLPARITGALVIPMAAFLLGYDWRGAWRIFWRDRHNHASPNSAHPEAAVAGALGVQFGGLTSYFGQQQAKPTIGDNHLAFKLEHIKQNVALVYVSSLLSFALVMVGLAVFVGY
ncbi:adenosylcobinamide-phosphate synthase CbiB [Motilimonas sp. KMU-193]|uniref:adenosylcobinamide-phosphate synthase CbiB n=1 Tax=Motilimonas sp. KMU-193 TaxID=3388668 RepID=UPI00396B3C54